MSKQSLLLVDGDTRSLRVLEVSLRKAGFSVTPAVSVGDALEKLEVNAPDLIISETKFATDLDGFELRRRLRGMPDWAEIPFIFLTAETAIENKIKGLELGVDDYLTKPIYIKEIVTRINILLQKRQRQFLDLKKDGTRFAGRVADMPVVDVIQTIEVSRKSGIIQFSGGPNRQAAIYFRDGKVIDAEAGTLQGEDAVYRLLTWGEGEFEVEFRTVRRREVITTSSQGLLMEGMRRLDEWSRLLEQLPPLSHRFEIDAAELSGRLGEVPDDNNRILRLFDSKRTLLEVIDASDFGDLECLQAISRLYFEGLLTDLDPGQRTKRETGKPGPLLVVDGSAPTPIEDAASGQIDVKEMTSRSNGNATAAEPPRTLTMGWDAQPDPTEASQAKPTSVTTGWDAQPDPTQAPQAKPTSVTTGWDAQPDPDELVATPAELAAERAIPPPPRARRDSGVQIDDQDVVAEEEVPDEHDVQPPLSGAYRPSSLRLIDEAVAAAQLIEPSLFEPEELARLGIKPAAPSPDKVAETPSEEAAAIARMKRELDTADPTHDASARDPAPSDVAASSDSASTAVPEPRSAAITVPSDAVISAMPISASGASDASSAPVAASGSSDALTDASTASDAPTDASSAPAAASGLSDASTAAAAASGAAASVAGGPPPPPMNGSRRRKKTVPPPVPTRTPAKVSPRDIEEAPLLDSNLLTSGEHRLPSDNELDDSTPLLDSNLLTSGEYTLPTDAQLSAIPDVVKPDPSKPVGLIRVPLPDSAEMDPPTDTDDYSGVPTVIEAEEENQDDDGSDHVGGPTNLELPSRRSSQPIRRDESQPVHMIGSHGRDRAEASGELKLLGRAGTEPGVTQRELVTILPRRKTGEVAQLPPEVAAKLAAGAAKTEAAASNGASKTANKDAKSGIKDTKTDAKDVKDAKPDKGAPKPVAKDAKADAKDSKSDVKDTKSPPKPHAKADARSDKPPSSKPAVEPPSSPPRRVSVEGGVVAVSRGPGRVAQVLIALSVMIAGATAFTLCRKDKEPAQKSTMTMQDASAIAVASPDATEYHGFGVDGGVAPEPADAATVVRVPEDAATVAVTPRDAGTVAVATADAGVDKNREARVLYDRAHAALEDGDPDAALALLDQSLKLRKQARTLLERARALQRLRRIDDAIASIEDAIKMNDSYAPAWEQKGMLLWSEKRYGEARPALEMYLQLDPDGRKAETIRSMLDEPR